jgi:hypothetical protein
LLVQPSQRFDDHAAGFQKSVSAPAVVMPVEPARLGIVDMPRRHGPQIAFGALGRPLPEQIPSRSVRPQFMVTAGKRNELVLVRIVVAVIAPLEQTVRRDARGQEVVEVAVHRPGIIRVARDVAQPPCGDDQGLVPVQRAAARRADQPVHAFRRMLEVRMPPGARIDHRHPHGRMLRAVDVQPAGGQLAKMALHHRQVGRRLRSNRFFSLKAVQRGDSQHEERKNRMTAAVKSHRWNLVAGW